MHPRITVLLQITGFVLAVVIIGWGIWAVFFRAPGAPIVPGILEPAGEGGRLPEIGEGPSGQVIEPTGPSTLIPEPAESAGEPDAVAAGGRTLASPLTQERVAFPSLAAGGNFRYYNESDGRFYRLSSSGGEPVLLSNERFPSVEKVTWSGSGERAVLEFPDGSNIVYNFSTGERATLPRAASEFSFSPDEQSLAYEYLPANADDRWVIVSDTSGQGQQFVQPIGRESVNIQVAWSPNNQVVATYREPTSSAGEEVFFIGLAGENFLSLQTGGLGFTGAWSPTGKQMLYSVYSEGTNYNPVLYIAAAEGEDIGRNNRSLRLSTWPEKCVFSGEETLYCAVPQSLEQGSGIFPELAANVPDSIYKIDLVSNAAVPLALPEAESGSSFAVEQLLLSEDGSELYFTDRVNGFIHRLRLR